MRRCALHLMPAVLLGGVLGCGRDLPYQAPAEQPIVGYQIEGYVTDQLGVPLKNIQIALWYDYEFVDTLRSPSASFFVDDSTKSVLLRVLDRNQKVEVVLFEGQLPVGPVDTSWNRRDASGAPVPSGVYTVDFSMNGVPRASCTVVVDGAVTAVTDSLGHYVIPDENLPVGFYPVPRFSNVDPMFNGNYRITSLVALELYIGLHPGTSFSLTKDQVTRYNFII